MIIAGRYSFNKGKEVIEENYLSELKEIKDIIHNIDSKRYRTKTSEEKTMKVRKLYNSKELNKAFTQEFTKRNWEKHRV